MITVALTGATGFIGQHIIAELRNHDVEVIAVSRFQPDSLPSIQHGHWVQIDLSKPPSNVFKLLGQPDVLIHLAWNGLPNYRSLHHFENELPIQYAFLKNMIEQGLKSVVVSGTCYEYGMQSGSLSEDMETRPVNPYGLAKDVLRKQLEFFQATCPFNLTWARLFYMYGSGQNESSLFPQLKQAVKRGDNFFNMSGGEQLRDYLPVSEVAKRLVLLGLGMQNIGIVNICSGKPISVRTLIEQWIQNEKWDITLNIGFYSYPDYEPMAFWGDRKKLAHLLEQK